MYSFNTAPDIREGLAGCVNPLRGDEYSALGALPENESKIGPTGITSHFTNAAIADLPLPKYPPLKWASAADQGVKVAFPYEIPPPHYTGNLWWHDGRAILNAGQPRWLNDPREYLRSAMVDSDWDAVEKWMVWQVANGMTYQGLTEFLFSVYKYIGGGASPPVYLPFSRADYETFYRKFKRFANGDPASERCIDDTRKKIEKFNANQVKYGSGGRVPYQLMIGVCPTRGVWWRGFLIMAAAVAAIYGGATLIANIAAGSGTAGATGAAGAAGEAGSTAAGSAASVASTATTAGAASAAEMAVIPGVLETVTITAAPITGGISLATAGTLAAGAASILSSLPQSVTDALARPIDTGSPTSGNDSTAVQDTASASRSVMDQAIDWLKQQGLTLTKEQLTGWLSQLLGRAPTNAELGYASDAAISRSTSDNLSRYLPILGLIFASAILLPEKRKR